LFRFSSLFFAVLSSTKPAPLSLHDALPISAFLPCSPRCVLSFPAARVVAPLAASFAELVLELARVIAEELDLRREACALAFEVVASALLFAVEAFEGREPLLEERDLAAELGFPRLSGVDRDRGSRFGLIARFLGDVESRFEIGERALERLHPSSCFARGILG